MLAAYIQYNKVNITKSYILRYTYKLDTENVLPTLREYMSLGGFLSALRVQRLEMYIFEYIYLYWIFFANIWGIYFTRRVSVRPSAAW